MIKFDQNLHRAGQAIDGPISPSLIQATAWWIVAELIRRHSDKLMVIETHPAGGTYDCRSIYRIDGDTPRLVVHLNLEGSITHGSWFSGREPQDRFTWAEAILTPYRRRYIVEQIECQESLGVPSSTPPTTAASVGPRVVAAFLARTALGGMLGRHSTTSPQKLGWMVLNGYFDTDGMSPGPRLDLFEAFPQPSLKESLEMGSSPFGNAAYRFWFVVSRRGVPQAAIDMTGGRAWNRHKEFDLVDEYITARRKLDPIVNRLLPAAV